MKRLSMLCIGLVMALSISVGADAMEDMYITSNDAVIINGQADEFEGDYITLRVLNKSYDEALWDNIRNGEDSHLLTYFDVAELSDEGEYSFNFIPQGSGVYECTISNESSDPFYLYYTNTNDTSEGYKAIKNISLDDKNIAIEDIKSCIDEYRYAFGIFGELYNDADMDETAEFVCNYLLGKDILPIESKSEESNLSRVIKHSMLASVVNNGGIEDIDKYINELALYDIGLDYYYDERYKDVLQSELNDRKYTNADEFTKTLIEIFTGIEIQYNDGIDDMKNIIEKYSKISGIKDSFVTVKMCKSIAGSSKYYDFETLKSYVEDYKEESSNKGGGSSGGSGSGKKKTPTVGVVSMPTKNTQEEINQIKETTILFKDVPESFWAREMIEELYNKGVISGKGNNMFCPNENITRAEFVKLVVTAMNLNTIGKDLEFSDVKESDWYHKYIYIAFNSEIVNGMAKDYFGAKLPITRQDLAVMAYNTMKVCDLSDNGISDNGFNDVENIADYAKTAVSALKGNGILSGDDEGNFRPQDNTTRAEAAKIIYMLMQLK